MTVSQHNSILSPELTSTVRRLPYADLIIVLEENGKLAQQGTFAELNSSKGYIQNLQIELQNNFEPDLNIEVIAPETELAPFADPVHIVSRGEGDRRTGDTTIYFYYMRVIGFTPSVIFIAGLSLYVFCVTYQR